MTATWDVTAVILVITSIGGIIVSIIGAIFAGLAMLRAGRANTKVDAVGGTVEAIGVKTDGTMTRLTEQNKMLAEKIEAMAQSQIAGLTAAHQAALTRVRDLEAEVVKRADAMPPPGGEVKPDELATIAETLEHDRRNRKMASENFQVVIEDLNKQIRALQQQVTTAVAGDGGEGKAA